MEIILLSVILALCIILIIQTTKIIKMLSFNFADVKPLTAKLKASGDKLKEAVNKNKV
jgi:hypothetical protein